MSDTSAIVLCGGRSSRMGRPKAWLPWRGRPMVAHVVDVLHEVVDDVVVVTSEALEVPPLRARLVRDEQPGLGPLGGLRAGLQHARGELCFVTSTDAPFLTGAFVRAVLAPGIAAAPVSDGHIQTLAAAYPRAPGAEKARELLAAGRRRPLDLLEALGYRELPAETLPDAGALEGFNTPDEYLAAVGEAAEDGQAATATLEFLGHARQLAGCDSMKVPVGRLGRVLDHAPASAGFVENGRLAAAFLVSLGGCYSVRDLAVPIGPGEHVQLRDAATSISRPTPGHLDD